MKFLLKLPIVVIIVIIVVMSFESEKSIIYRIPEDVSLKIKSNIFGPAQNDKKYICILSNKIDTTTLLFVDVTDESDELAKMYSLSNRKVQIGKHLIPIVFYSDFRFSTIFNTLNKDSTVTNVNFNFGGYFVLFKGRFLSGHLISSGQDR